MKIDPETTSLEKNDDYCYYSEALCILKEEEQGQQILSI